MAQTALELRRELERLAPCDAADTDEVLAWKIYFLKVLRYLGTDLCLSRVCLDTVGMRKLCWPKRR